MCRWMIKVGRVGTWTGRAWYLPMALLFIPVSRNSPFLRLVNLPFEHAVRFHRWLGHFSLVILLLHSITFALHIYYTGGGSMKGVSLIHTPSRISLVIMQFLKHDHELRFDSTIYEVGIVRSWNGPCALSRWLLPF